MHLFYYWMDSGNYFRVAVVAAVFSFQFSTQKLFPFAVLYIYISVLNFNFLLSLMPLEYDANVLES